MDLERPDCFSREYGVLSRFYFVTQSEFPDSIRSKDVHQRMNDFDNTSDWKTLGKNPGYRSRGSTCKTRLPIVNAGTQRRKGGRKEKTQHDNMNASAEGALMIRRPTRGA